MELESLTIIGGTGRDGTREHIEGLEIRMGEIVSVVGPTGSGKTALINDIELFANRNTPSGRKVLINGEPAPMRFIEDPAQNPVALITQHTNFLSDLPVKKFLEIHARIRRGNGDAAIVRQTLDYANELTGESIILDSAMTELSGGQTRALLIADAVIIGASPILLLDEIENAGIHRVKALEMLHDYRKIFIFVTHDPRIALLSDFRIIMKNGAMRSVIKTDESEREASREIAKIDDMMLGLKRKIWRGERLGTDDLSPDERWTEKETDDVSSLIVKRLHNAFIKTE